MADKSKPRLMIPAITTCLQLLLVLNRSSMLILLFKSFFAENFIIVLFDYDGKVSRWWDLDWSDKTIDIVAQNQTQCNDNIKADMGATTTATSTDDDEGDEKFRSFEL